MGAPEAVQGEGQFAFLDHVMTVVDGETASAIANSEMLRAFGRFDVGTVESDGEAWTGRYLFGRRTYVEIFGPEDYENGPPSAAGLGLSTRARGDLSRLVERAAGAGVRLLTGRRTLQEEGQVTSWFDYAEPDDQAQPGRAKLDHASASFEIWVMEFLTEPDDHELRDTRYREWYQQTGGTTPALSEVTGVELGVSAANAAVAARVLDAAGFTVTRTARLVTATDSDTMIRLHVTDSSGVGVRRMEFALVGAIDERSDHQLGRSLLTVGPGQVAEWMFHSG